MVEDQIDGYGERRQAREQDEPDDLREHADRVGHEQEQAEDPEDEKPAEDDDREDHAPARRELKRADEVHRPIRTAGPVPAHPPERVNRHRPRSYRETVPVVASTSASHSSIES